MTIIHYICQPGLGKPAAKKFQIELNQYLSEGWTYYQGEPPKFTVRGLFRLRYFLDVTLVKELADVL